MEFSDLEAKILVIIKEYLNKNRVFNAKKIIPFILNGLKVFKLDNPPNEKGLQKIIWRFISERIVVPGSKLTQDNLLTSNSTRKAIYNHIDKNPGTYLREIMDQYQLGSHECLWHLNLLIKFGYIRFASIGKFKVFFDNQLPNTYDREIFYLGNKNINEIIQLLFMNGEGLTINQISEQLGIHFNTANNSMHKLNEVSLLFQKDENGNLLYMLNQDQFKAILDGIESIKAT